MTKKNQQPLTGTLPHSNIRKIQNSAHWANTGTVYILNKCQQNILFSHNFQKPVVGTNRNILIMIMRLYD